LKLIIFDVDGVLTDNTVYIGPDGYELKRFSIADGLGMYLARKHGLQIAFVSGRPSLSTTERAKELQVADVFQEPTEKLDFYNQLKAKYALSDEEIAFVGNDLVDLRAMRATGVAVAAPGSPEAVLKEADYVTKTRGGFGAAREILDLILKAKGIDEEKQLD